MTDKQTLNLLRYAVNCAETLEDAKAYAEFIANANQPYFKITPDKVEMSGQLTHFLNDGVYVATPVGAPKMFKDLPKDEDIKGCMVIVSYHGHYWTVALHDLECGETPLLKEDAERESESPFYKSEIDAINDFDMQACTDHLRKAGLAFELDEKLCVPTAGQLAAMYLFREDLNEALKAVGGEPLKSEVYWSSSEASAYYSWYVYFNSGYVNYWNNKFNNGYVRPCTAFTL